MPHPILTLSFCKYCKQPLSITDEIAFTYHTSCQTQISNYTPPKLSPKAKFIQIFPEYQIFYIDLLIESRFYIAFAPKTHNYFKKLILKPVSTIRVSSQEANIIKLDSIAYYLDIVNDVLNLLAHAPILTDITDPTPFQFIKIAQNQDSTLALFDWQDSYVFIAEAPYFPSEIVNST